MKQRILLKGKDGIDLLQRITTLDFGRIKKESWQTGLILNPQGKILSHFEVQATNSTDTIEIRAYESLLKLLDQYTFGERYQLETHPLAEPTLDSEAELKRIQSRTPRMGCEFDHDGQTNPLEINFDTAIHDQKGCYPGQEVIEKIIAIGSPAKRLCLIRRQSSTETININPAFNLPVEFEGGRLTSFQEPYGLAILRKTLATPGIRFKVGEIEFEVVE